MSSRNDAQDRPSNAPKRTTEHLANERTFLAWIRTGLGLSGLGFVLARMGLFLRQLAVTANPTPPRHPRGGHEFLAVGVVFLFLGTMLSAWSGWLYHRTRRAIETDRYEPAWRSVLALTAVLVLGGLALIALVVWQTWTTDHS